MSRFDNGENFITWEGSLPRVAIHDMVIQARDNELVLGTHGRSIYISKLDKIQKYPKVKDKDLSMLPLTDMNYNEDLGHKSSAYAEPQSMKMSIDYFTKDTSEHTFSILNKKGKVLQTFTEKPSFGFNTATYDLSVMADKAKLFSPVLKKAKDDNIICCRVPIRCRSKTPMA
ncbi:hypothetical protein EMGBS15_18140 [Filimonas sp.]|nr:hypothetical protein EMGBS15_18140 [Filimonas sp.]